MLDGHQRRYSARIPSQQLRARATPDLSGASGASSTAAAWDEAWLVGLMHRLMAAQSLRFSPKVPGSGNCPEKREDLETHLV